MRTLLALGALAIGTTMMGRSFGWQSPVFMGSEVALLSFILVVYRFLLPLMDRHDRGASGEELVGGLLDGLTGPRWRVLHDVSLGRGDIDHLVIGPAGVFTVETKSHPGPIAVERLHGRLLRQANAQRKLLVSFFEEGRVAGLVPPRDPASGRSVRPQDASPNGPAAEAPAESASRAPIPVEIPVEPLLVYSRAWIDRPLARRKGVRILPARMLVRYLSRRPQRLDADQVAAVHAAVLEAAAPPRVPAAPRGSVRARVHGRAPSHP